MKTWQANILLLIVAIIWGAGFIATEVALKYLEPLQMQIFRFGIAAIIATIVFYKRLINVSRNAIIYGSLLGLAFFVAMTFQSFGLVYTTVPKNAFITVTNVIWVPLILFVFTRLKPKSYLLYGIIVMIIGFFFLIFQVDVFNLSSSLAKVKEQANFNFGDFLTLLCAIAFAVHFILGDKYVKSEDPITILLFQLYVSTILSIALSCFMEGNPLAMPLDNVVKAMPSLLFAAIFSSIISFALLLVAQQYVPAANTAIICSMESLFASVFAVLLGSVPLTSSLIIASILITIGIIWAETGFDFKSD